MQETQDTSIDSLVAEALEILDHAELAAVEGGLVPGWGCPRPFDGPDWQDLFASITVGGALIITTC